MDGVGWTWEREKGGIGRGDQEEESNIIIFPRRPNIKSPAIMSLIRSGTFFEQFPGFRQDRPDGDDTQTPWLRQQRLHGREKQY